MKFNSLFPVIWTDNLEESIGFYTHVLGFSLIDANSKEHWAFIEKDKVKIMLTLPKHKTSIGKIGFSGSFYFNISNVNELWEDLNTITKICYRIENFAWGMREFAIYDNNGYILQFGQAINEISTEE
ncbi:hypothetical protein CHRY9390_00125 [Chryseobacterium aquaeductus]|uniref:VOC domain-containing protein n=1 Tax=Chryseobacterium aquaeductus TaxID=2675056 RepID=A0A9N8QQQ8_9FLAO|nr:VOC family protein [Chryseobacterium aquaeductus]CAA7329487.1 hypothetical protein CHRY9390_00125 [Chryseobacterium potabilaquae]CAD7797186.1 hypothetical protein CHRY9390_00125 [Chryseobacterium aquaeductus]